MCDQWFHAQSDQNTSRHLELLREAERERLAHLAGAGRVTPLQRVILRFSHLLISSGMYLKRHSHARREQTYLPTMHFNSRAEY